MSKLLPWQQIENNYNRINDLDKIVGMVIKDRMSYKAIFWKGDIEVRDYFISLLAAKNYVDEKLIDQGYCL